MTSAWRSLFGFVFMALGSLSCRDNCVCLNKAVCEQISSKEIRVLYKGIITIPAYAFENYSSIEVLWMQGNRIDYIDRNAFSGLTNLRQLVLTNNSIRSLPEGVFDFLPKLERLSLALNQLSSLPGYVFANLNGLLLLDLRHNDFSTFTPAMMSSLSNQILYASNNPLDCSCDLVHLINKMSQQDKSTCHYPWQRRGQLFGNLNETELCTIFPPTFAPTPSRREMSAFDQTSQAATATTNLSEHFKSVLRFLTETQITKESAQSVVDKVVDIVQDPSWMNADDIDNVVTLLERVHEKAASPEMLDDFLYVANSLMELNGSLLQETHKQSKASSRVIVLIEEYIEYTMLTNHMDSYNATYSNIAAEATVINGMASNGEGIVALEEGDDWLYRHQGDVNDPSETSTAFVFVPPAVINEASKELGGTSKIVVQFVVYRSSKLFSRVIDRSWESVLETSSGYQVNSFVISCRIGSVSVKNFSAPIVLKFSHISEGKNPICSWWDFNRKPFDDWSGVGCATVNESSNQTECHCYHLTNFAVLMDLSKQIDGVGIPDRHERVLAVITYIGCAVSSFGLILTILTILCFPQFRKSTTNQLLVNLSAALLLLVVVFAGGIARTDYQPACIAVATLLHFSLLAALMWMSAEAVNLYLAVVRVSNPRSRNFLVGSLAICWGLPAIVVIVCASTWTESYGGDDYCWIQDGVFYVGLLTPALAITLFNSGVFAMIVHALKVATPRELKTKKGKRSVAAVRQRLKASTSVLVLLGLTWAFGALTIGDARLVFQYLFVVFNSLQGFFIFVFHCAARVDVRRAWAQRLRSSESSRHPYRQSIDDDEPTTRRATDVRRVRRDRPVGGVQCRTASGRTMWKALQNN